jgi:hypothetical protein
MDIHTIGMVAGAFLAGTLVPYVFKSLMALRKKKRQQRYRRPVRRHVHRFFPDNDNE